MSWSKKINSKTYAIGATGNLAIATVFGYPVISSMAWLYFLIFTSFLNHYSSVYVVSKLFDQAQGKKFEMNKKKLVFHLFLKGLSLILGFYCLVTYARSMVLQGLLLYIFQLIILGLSIKNIEQLIKKGTEK